MAERMSGPRYLAYYAHGPYAVGFDDGPIFVVSGPAEEQYHDDHLSFDEFFVCPAYYRRPQIKQELAYGQPRPNRGAIPLEGLCLFEWGGWK